MIVKVIIPAFNEEKSISHVIKDIPDLVSEVVVCDNNSTDRTAEMARNAGATVVSEPLAGYGRACLKAMSYYACSFFILKNYRPCLCN